MLTATQIRWASEHDWFERDNGDGTILVWDRWVNLVTGEAHHQLKAFEGTFAELREWAGY